MDAITERKRRIALLLQYDGTNFNGIQIQDKGRTVQEELEKAIKILIRENIRISASGRTDTGVHAFGQVVHFDTDSDMALKRIAIGLNGILPPDVSVKNVYDVDPDFHSRFSAVQREYCYFIYNHPQRTPFMLYRSMWVNYSLDVDYLQKTVNYLIGENDFASFCKKKSKEDNTMRRIHEIKVIKKEDLIEVRIRGNAFLHNMIRIIIGTVLEMAKEGRKPEYILEIMNEKDRDAGGFTAPPYGLYLSRIWFDPDLSEFSSAFKSEY